MVVYTVALLNIPAIPREQILFIFSAKNFVLSANKYIYVCMLHVCLHLH